MPQPIDDSPAWWDGTIAIPFSKEEWKLIADNLRWEYSSDCLDPDCDCVAALNIVDRIEKSIGEE